MTRTWTEARVQYLQGMWGHTTAQKIAEALGDGITRDAVIGKAHRIGLTGAKDLVVDRKLRVFKFAPRVDGGRGKYSFEEIAGNPMCKFEMGGNTWCGKRCRGSWCAEHQKVVYARTPGKNNFDEAV